MADLDPLNLDHEQLSALASAKIIRRGIQYFKEARVVEVAWHADRSRLWGSVDGNGAVPYQVAVDHDEGELLFECDCPFEWEPICKHGVALLLAYSARQPVSETAAQSAADEAIEDRARRGKVEVEIRRVSDKGWPSVWRAWSTGTPQRAYRVEMRARDERINFCTCPDFATNRLSTCKHIEAVAHRLRKRKRRAGRRGDVRPLVYVDWSGERPLSRLRGLELADPATARVLTQAFDEDGRFRGDPSELIPLAQTLEGHDLVFGEDARRFGQRTAMSQLREAAADHIRDEIRRTGGRLPGVHATLYPYQIDGVAFLVGAQRAILADDMGLGKTLQAIAATSWMMGQGVVQRALVVCPASLKHQWAREIERFTGRSTQVIQGRADARLAQYRAHADFTIVNYELVLRDRSVLATTLSPDLLILDEAQRIKNWRTKTADAIKRIATRFVFVLTGTPLENRLEDLYSLMQAVDPHVLGPLWQFMLQFHVTGERGEVYGYRNLSELRRRLNGFMLRRDRRLVRDQLPEKIVHRRDVGLTERQQELHDGAMRTAGSFAAIAQRRPLTPNEQQALMAALQQARMACNAAGLVDKETEGSPKLTELAQLLEELVIEGGHKVVVFSEWAVMTEMAEAVVQRLGLGSVRLHGSVPTGSRGALIERFDTDPAVQVFISTDAGGVGLNLQSATALINLDVPWNPAVLEQRFARIHRLGQRAQVQIVMLVAQGAYESQVLALVEAKRALFHSAVEDGQDDVVGVSKRLLEIALESVGVAPEQPAGGGEAQVAPPETTGSGSQSMAGGPMAPEDSAWLTELVAKIQARFGPRVERIVGANGGILVVVRDHATESDRRWAAAFERVEVAILDPHAFAVVRRMFGEIQPLAGPGEATAESPYRAPARRKLRAAQALIAGDCAEEAAPLVAEAVRFATAAEARIDPPAADAFAVWLHDTAIPAGVDADFANNALWVHALAVAAPPPAMLDTLVDRASALVCSK